MTQHLKYYGQIYQWLPSSVTKTKEILVCSKLKHTDNKASLKSDSLENI